jgi:Protein of unknown function (DUF3105)
VRRGTLGVLACALIVAAGALAVLVTQFGTRDSSTTAGGVGPGRSPPDQGDAHSLPGGPPFRYASDPPASGPHIVSLVTRDAGTLSTDQLLTAIELGDVVLVYADPHLTSALRSLARAQAGPFTPALAATGQAVVLDRRASPAGAPVAAVAWGHLLRVRSASDPGLTVFVQAWLGRGAPGARAR